MRVLVVGAQGMLGEALTRFLLEVRGKNYTAVPITRREFDIAADPFSKLATLCEGAEAVVNCAAVIKPRIADTPVEQVLRVNAIFPRNLAAYCLQNEIPCIHITTDAVYSGTRGGYDENDLFEPADLYSISKNAGETKDCMVLRTSIIGEEPPPGRSLFAWAKSQAGKSVKGFVNHRWNGMTSLHLAEVCETILSRKLYERGIFHVYSPQTINKFELLSAINEIYGLNLRIEPCDGPMACDWSLSSIYPLASELCRKSISLQLQEMKDFFARKS